MVIKSIWTDKKLLFGILLEAFYSGPHILFEVFMMNWLRSFNPKDGSGPLHSKDAVTSCFQYQGVGGTIPVFLLIYFFGHANDKINPAITIPLSFLLRALCYFSFFFITDP